VARDPNSRLAYSTDGAHLEKQRRAAEPAASGDGSRIRIRLERRASGRLVTAVSGLPGPAAASQALARELKAACGAGGTLKDGVLELQGDHRDAVERALATRGLRSKRAGG
jgi:translation initiation factor 1